MSKITERAAEARALSANAALQNVIADIREDAVQVFLNTSSTVEQREAAHDRVRAVQTILDAIQARVDAEKIEQKRDQHRGND